MSSLNYLILVTCYLCFFYSSAGHRKNRKLTIVSVAHTNIPPKEPVVYNKQTQTIQTTHTSHDGESLYSFYNLLIALYVASLLYIIRQHPSRIYFVLILIT